MSGGDRRCVPDAWIAGVNFTSVPEYSPGITADLQKALHTPTAATAAWPKVGLESLRSPSSSVQIRAVTRHGHPANGHHGLYARKHLPPDSFIICYIGLIHTDAPDDTDDRSDYDLSMDRELGISIDAARTGNEARFVNDYRRIAEAPNAEFRDCWVQMPKNGEDSRARWERRMGIFVLGPGRAGKKTRGIRSGEEILVNYGRNFWTERATRRQEEKDSMSSLVCVE